MLRQELEQVLRDFAPPEEDSQLVVALAEALTETACRVMLIEEILETLQQLSQEYSHPNQREIRDALNATAQCISDLRQREETDMHAEEVLNSEDKRKQIQIASIRACVYRLHSEIYVLHFFSGRRRAGDLQQALEGLTPPDATMLFVISLDVMVSADHGNLTDENQQQAILRLIRQGAIAAGYAGPPCETWTVARFELVAARRYAPRPLRLKDQPWGLLHVSLREGQQLDIGNELMCFAIQALFEIAAMGGLSVLEHPRNPHDWNTKHAQAPSIWDTAIIRWLSATGLFHCLAVSQGNFGAKSAKPTWTVARDGSGNGGSS